ncbi:MAG TPA: enoyl-CoA hydratase/isomerase family protein, partial [Nitrospirota bacterium]
MSDTCISVECKDRINTIVIDNPPDNYLDKDVLSRLNRAVGEMLSDKTELRVVLLTAKGRNFSAGLDYAGSAGMSKNEAGHLADVGYHLLRNLENMPVPVIAAVKGETTGAGLGLALAADLRIAATDTVFSFPEARIG